MQNISVGNIVRPTKESGFILASGCGWYLEAVVVSVNPFILTSLESDMKWSCSIKQEDFEVIGIADEATLELCKQRLND